MVGRINEVMVARIRSGKQGKATLIEANGYAKDPPKLNFHEKVNRLQKLADLNTRAATNCLHVSLNFDPSEQLNTERLLEIAQLYMEKIGFAEQPYLVYEHKDAAHQHIHIVSTNIQRDGKRISMHDLGRLQSENARKEIEMKFGLVKAGAKQQKSAQVLTPVKLEKIQYGKEATKLAITNVITQVVSQYKFASLHELNAILKLYNVIADRGVKGSRMYEKRGLQFCILDAKGNKIGVPIKASSITGKPTLTNLEARFKLNKQAKQQYIPQIRTMIIEALQQVKSIEQFRRHLQQNNIDLLLRTNENNFVYGVTYIDHKTKTVFNGSELGKQCSANFIRENLLSHTNTNSANADHPSFTNTSSSSTNTTLDSKLHLLETLTDADTPVNYLPYGLRPKRKKRYKRNQ
jgi:hypothetical protein